MADFDVDGTPFEPPGEDRRIEAVARGWCCAWCHRDIERCACPEEKEEKTWEEKTWDA